MLGPVATAGAGSGKKHRAHHAHRAWTGPARQAHDAWQAPVLRRRGPPWAMPNECFNDEGYGRWSPCGGRDF
jgi:hypothetical protein